MTDKLIAVVVVFLMVAAAWRIQTLENRLAVQTSQHEAALARLAALSAQEDKARADAVALAERQAREEQEQQQVRMASLTSELAVTRDRLTLERQHFTRRIKDVAHVAARDCRGLSAGWVRLYNEALGLARADRGPGGQTRDPARIDPSAGPAGAAPAGIQLESLTTPEDVLAHVRDYGGYCQSVAAQLNTLARLAGTP